MMKTSLFSLDLQSSLAITSKCQTTLIAIKFYNVELTSRFVMFIGDNFLNFRMVLVKLLLQCNVQMLAPLFEVLQLPKWDVIRIKIHASWEALRHWLNGLTEASLLVIQPLNKSRPQGPMHSGSLTHSGCFQVIILSRHQGAQAINTSTPCKIHQSKPSHQVWRTHPSEATQTTVSSTVELDIQGNNSHVTI